MLVQKERFVPWVGLQCVIVVFPDHTHLLFVWLVQSGLYFLHTQNTRNTITYNVHIKNENILFCSTP